MVKDTTTVGEDERERQAAAEHEAAETVKPGEKLAKVDPAAHAATYNEDGTLKIKDEKPLATPDTGKQVDAESSLNGPADGVGTEAEVQDVQEGDDHPKSEGTDKVEVKHPETAESQDDANTGTADEPGSSVDTAGAVEASDVDQDQGKGEPEEVAGSDPTADPAEVDPETEKATDPDEEQ